MPNSSEESGSTAKNAFQEVPYSQCGEEVVHDRPEAAYKRLLEACGRMPHKSNYEELRLDLESVLLPVSQSKQEQVSGYQRCQSGI